MAHREALDVLTETVADLGEQRRRRDRVAAMLCQKPGHPTRRLQLRHIGIEVDAIQALDLKLDVTIEQLNDRQRRGHGPPTHG